MPQQCVDSGLVYHTDALRFKICSREVQGRGGEGRGRDGKERKGKATPFDNFDGNLGRHQP